MKLSLSLKLIVVPVFLLLGSLGTQAATEQSYTLFESGQVRPLALAPQGHRLYAVNTPNNALEVFYVTDSGLQHVKSIPVGMEPVAVALRSKSEAWVVNHLSDSVSIVSLVPGQERVVRTLLVGDEPRDIVFAGTDQNRAFITTAHRGQNVPYDPQLTTPGIGRADVWVFDTDKLGSSLTGDPLNIITLFTDTPRALAVSPDGKSVYAAGFKTGTQTTTVWHLKVLQNGGQPEPKTNVTGEDIPSSGLIVKWNGEHWVDEIGRIWDEHVKFNLPDKDVFIIDADANPPVLTKKPVQDYAGVGSVLFNMVVNPVNQKVYVSNMESHNEQRFEGHGYLSGKTVRGQFIKNRISILDKKGTVIHRHLNKHIDYSECCNPIPNEENARSLATPMGMAISDDGKTLYVAAFGSSKVGIYDTALLEEDKFVPSINNMIGLSGGGPSGLILDEPRKRLYVLTRFNNAISVINTNTKSEVANVTMFNPEPASVVKGRPFLYDAAYTSSRGDSSCAGCHIFGDMDQLAWDLGDPDLVSEPMYGKFRNTAALLKSPVRHEFSPMKGPMTTQSLRGMANHGPLHWRGDRTGADPDIDKNVQPDAGQFNEDIAFTQFNGAFVGLIGRDKPLSDDEMDAFTQFALQLTYPPNPIRNLDNSLTPDQQGGSDFFFGAKADTFFGCFECHVVDRDANKEFGVAKPGFFGTDGFYNVTRLSTQALKVPHLRNMYQKIGMFGFPNIPQLLPDVEGEENKHMGDQIKGFGFHHDGSRGTLFLQQSARGFIFRLPGTNGPKDPGNPNGYNRDRSIGDPVRRQTEQFLLAFDSNLFPVVGQQITLDSNNSGIVSSRIDLLIQQAEAGRCDLIAKQGTTGYIYTGSGLFKSSFASKAPLTDVELRNKAKDAFGEITYTCVPPGAGVRMGIDGDQDGVLDSDET